MKPGVTPAGGYTLLEVMIFLAISSLLLFVTNVVFSGQAAHTEFVDSMNNVNSKMQDWINGVSNGQTGNTSAADSHSGNYVCTIDGATNAPKLTSPQSGDDSVRGNANGSNLPCVFLGKAIYANDVNYKTSLMAYTVIGKRTYNNGSSTVLTDTLKNAAPTAAVFPSGVDPTINLSEEYKIPSGVQVRHVWAAADPLDTTSPPASIHNTLAGFFIDPANASNSLLAVQYPFTGSYDPTDWTSPASAWNFISCIDLAYSTCLPTSAPDNLWPMNTWDICFESTKGDERALLQIISTSGHGATTKLITGKSDVCL
jgi:hypothetical protein